MKDVESNRSILVTKAHGTEAIICASQPSDCKLLQRDHIQCASIDDLTLRFNADFMYDVNGVPYDETLEEWHDAISHLLHTYKPLQVSIYFGHHEPKMGNVYTVELPDASTYSGRLTTKRDAISLT